MIKSFFFFKKRKTASFLKRNIIGKNLFAKSIQSVSALFPINLIYVLKAINLLAIFLSLLNCKNFIDYSRVYGNIKHIILIRILRIKVLHK